MNLTRVKIAKFIMMHVLVFTNNDSKVRCNWSCVSDNSTDVAMNASRIHEVWFCIKSTAKCDGQLLFLRNACLNLEFFVPFQPPKRTIQIPTADLVHSLPWISLPCWCLTERRLMTLWSYVQKFKYFLQDFISFQRDFHNFLRMFSF